MAVSYTRITGLPILLAASGTEWIEVSQNTGTVDSPVYVSKRLAVASVAALSPSGTVTSVDVSGGSTGMSFGGGPVTSSGTITMSGTLGAGNGGTGLASYTAGDLLYASGSATLARLAGVATGNALLSGGVGVAPAWGKIALATHVSGTLPVANGGTGATSLTAHGLLLGQGTSAVTATAALTDGQIVVGQTGADPLPKTVSGDATLAASGALTVTQASTTFALPGTISATLAADQDNWSPTGLSGAVSIRIDGGAASRNITGLQGGASGRIITFHNVGSPNNIVLVNNSSSSSAGNRFLIGNDVTLLPDQSYSIVYDATSSAWRARSSTVTPGGMATGTVTSVAVSGGTTGLTTSGGPITTTGTITLGGTLAVANGGTGLASYTAGDLLYASGSTTLAKLAGVATGNALISGGVGTAPSWGKIALATHVSGTLSVVNGGTGITSFGTGVAAALGQNVTGAGGIVLATSPTLATPALGTPASGTLTNCTGLPISGVSGLATSTTANRLAKFSNTTGSQSQTASLAEDGSGNVSTGGKLNATNGVYAGYGPTYNEIMGFGKDDNSWSYILGRNADSGASAYSGFVFNAYGNSWGLRVGSLAANSNRMEIASDAIVSPNVRLSLDASTGGVRFAAYGAGTLTTDASGNVTASSDEALKDDIQPFTRGLTEILQIRPISYLWTAASGLDRMNRYTGFSAQNVEMAIPEAVGVDANGYLTIIEKPILAALVNAVKALAEQNLALTARITALEQGA